MNYLITGSSGFIGRKILDELKNSKIQNILRKRKEEADILNKQKLKQK